MGRGGIHEHVHDLHVDMLSFIEENGRAQEGPVITDRCGRLTREELVGTVGYHQADGTAGQCIGNRYCCLRNQSCSMEQDEYADHERFHS